MVPAVPAALEAPAGDSSLTVTLSRPEFRPDPSLSRAEMQSLQRELASAATFADDHALTARSVAIEEPADLTDGLPAAAPDGGDPDAPVVVGVDQAFVTEREEAVSAAVAIRDGAVRAYASAITPLSIPYIPGLLSFREGEPILAALDALECSPDLLVCDGSGRIHFRQAGLATHIGVICDLPSVGVAKSLLCGTPDEAVDERPAGWTTPIRADETVACDEDRPILGYAFQSRQYPKRKRVNPLYVSAGHRVSASTAVKLVEALCAGYKLPEPTRLADAHADRVRRQRMSD